MLHKNWYSFPEDISTDPNPYYGDPPKMVPQILANPQLAQSRLEAHLDLAQAS